MSIGEQPYDPYKPNYYFRGGSTYISSNIEYSLDNKETFAALYETALTEGRQNKTIIYIPGHDNQYAAEQKRPNTQSTTDDKTDEYVIEGWLNQGYNVIVASTVQDITLEKNQEELFTAINTAVQNQRNENQRIVWAGHSYGGALLEQGISKGMIKVDEENDLVILQSAPEDNSKLKGLGAMAKTAWGRRIVTKIQSLTTKEKHYNREAHDRRLRFLGALQKATGNIITRMTETGRLRRFHSEKDVYVEAPGQYYNDQYTEYSEVDGINPSYSEFSGSNHNFVPFTHEMIEYTEANLKSAQAQP